MMLLGLLHVRSYRHVLCENARCCAIQQDMRECQVRSFAQVQEKSKHHCSIHDASSADTVRKSDFLELINTPHHVAKDTCGLAGVKDTTLTDTTKCAVVLWQITREVKQPNTISIVSTTQSGNTTSVRERCSIHHHHQYSVGSRQPLALTLGIVGRRPSRTLRTTPCGNHTAAELSSLITEMNLFQLTSLV